MLFNSLEFALFLPIVFGIYWILGSSRKYQNVLLLLSSYVFYGWWDWRFLFLIFLSSLVDFLIGRRLSEVQNVAQRKLLLGISLATNLGILGFFKYFNFFISSFSDLLTALGFQPNVYSLSIILPVGISFYTFQTLSYTIDIYRRQLEPSKDWIDFFAFVSFFPQLVAGPIERAKNLLPQFARSRDFSIVQAKDGLRQILWGLFKKVVVADNCAVLVDQIFGGNIESTGGVTLIFGAIFFAFQIYGDFSGYSDIAIGTSKLFGFDLMTNFRYPYFASNIREFWQKWHISLSTWFRDYVYIPIGGSRAGPARQAVNSMITFLVSGLWHGANWTFVVWGGLHGLYYFLHTLFQFPTHSRMTFSFLARLVSVLTTFSMVTFAWIFFRSPNIDFAITYIHSLFYNLFQHYGAIVVWVGSRSGVFIGVLLLIEVIGHKKNYPLENLNAPVPLRWFYYASICSLILSQIQLGQPQEFIYFQF